MRTPKPVIVYKVDLSKIDRKGDFPCPHCGTKISPDDTSDKTYEILDINVNSHGLDEIVLRCNSCESEISLTGFSPIEQLIATPQKRSRRASTT